MIDNPPGQNRGVYQVGHKLDANGNVTGGWTGWIDVPEWFSWENQGGGVAVVNRGADNDLVAFAIDNPPGQNQAFYRVLPVYCRWHLQTRLVQLAGRPELVLLREPGRLHRPAGHGRQP